MYLQWLVQLNEGWGFL